MGDYKMATIQQGGSSVTATSTRNAGGAVVRAKNTTLVDGVGIGGSTLGFVGSKVLVGTDVAKAVSAALIAYNTRQPVGMKVSSTIGGQANTTLRSGALVPSQIRGIHKIESVLTRRELTAIRAGKFNFYTGQWDAGYPVVVNDTGVSGAGDGLMLVDDNGDYTDTAATPTRAVPGRLTFKGSSRDAVTVNYKAKNG
jgi:hypothetical protein